MSSPRQPPNAAAARLQALLTELEGADDKERADLERMRGLLQELDDPFSRSQLTAHFTGSALVVDPAGARVLLVFHRKLERWLQPGGHAEPEDGGDLARTALRETREETGLEVEVHPASRGPIDADVHLIPARKDEPAHWHLDLRFLLLARNPERLAIQAEEATQGRWVTFDEALRLADEAPLRRLLQKGRRFASVGQERPDRRPSR